jgi:hypothetical protein
MVQTVIALCLFIAGELVEHRIQPDISTCLKMKREATRNMEMNNKRFMCSEAKAEVEKNIDGSISIKTIIEH